MEGVSLDIDESLLVDAPVGADVLNSCLSVSNAQATADVAYRGSGQRW